jgi:opacity protein-like surface antigen
MIRRSFVLAVALAAISAGPALAADDVAVTTETTTETTTTDTAETPYGGKGAVHIAIGGVYAFENVDGVPGGVKDGGGYDIRVGYGLCDWAALEIEWQSLVNLERDALHPVTMNEEPDLEARMLSLNGRFSPLRGRIQPYGLIGGGWFNVQADQTGSYSHESSFAMRFGVGVVGFVTQRIGLAVEAAYILPLTGDLGGGESFDLIPITASLFFNFE